VIYTADSSSNSMLSVQFFLFSEKLLAKARALGKGGADENLGRIDYCSGITNLSLCLRR
jgi:hypothetical protein